MLLSLEDLTTVFPSASGPVRAVNQVSFSIDRGEVLAVVGESGSGKSVTALSATRLVPQPPAIIESGRALLDGEDMLALPMRKMRRLLGRRVAMLFQNAFAALHPLRSIGDQLLETIVLHREVSRSDALRIGVDLLRSLGFVDPPALMKRYSFDVSAGDAQRAMLAFALAGEPDLLIADEPTSLLDAVAQDEILTLLKQIQARTGMAIWLITHDFGVVSRLADRVVVMYGGRAVESGPVDALLGEPRHPYSRGLIASVPDANARGRLRQIPGEIPDLARLPAGCAFRARCDRAQTRCGSDEPVALAVGDGRTARCWLYSDAA
ncbi:ABC transporter ATP-binding protein [Caballeronia sp. LZ065]|uniref:ABC transporter ATP-binding protein n=1 Tax=Caballeronia sp. LZ065 TaxID=3038571 RepID=UPI002863A554|nr:ABC transporter ATP-binding protein [Caballeronia sp. LZ065]MDR5781136.1 ABC transporter ATP-binding protein [Caballeronia sp. LZ065]